MKLLRSGLFYSAACFLCLVILAGITRLWRADLSMPWQYAGDEVMYQFLTKQVIDDGWYLHSTYTGAPTGADFHDFNQLDALHFGVLKVIAYFKPDAVLALNVYFLLTFPLTMLSALFVFRRFGCSRGTALVCSLLYAFLPYHFFRGHVQPTLGAYYLIPLLTLVALWVYQDGFTSCSPDHGSDEIRTSLRHGRVLGSGVICALVGCAYVYYAYFGCFLLLIAGIAVCWQRRSVRPGLWAGTYITVILAGALLTALPSLAYFWKHGTNPAIMAARDKMDGEVYSLQITQMLMPLEDHRWRALGRVKRNYNEAIGRLHLVNGNNYAWLGLVGGVGFLWLLARLMRRPPVSEPPDVAQGLCLFNIFAFVLGTIGGFGSLIYYAVTRWFRGYDRISIYIAFFCFFAVALLLDALARRCRTTGRRLAFHLLLVVVLLGGILDMTTPALARLTNPAAQREYLQDREFVRAIEAIAGDNGTIFQLPWPPFQTAGVPSGWPLTTIVVRTFTRGRCTGATGP
jgi:phosphoglycerol transferase